MVSRDSRLLQAVLRVSRPVAFCVTLGLCLTAQMSSAETRYIKDEKGRVVLEIRDDGTRITYTYADDNRVTQTRQPDGFKIELSKDAVQGTNERH